MVEQDRDIKQIIYLNRPRIKSVQEINKCFDITFIFCLKNKKAKSPFCLIQSQYRTITCPLLPGGESQPGPCRLPKSHFIYYFQHIIIGK